MNEMIVKRKLKCLEILVLVGILEKLKIVIYYGVDVVYIGGNVYGLRSCVGNFIYEEMVEGVVFVKEYDVKVYVVVNMVIYEGNEEGVGEFFCSLCDVGIFVVIVFDLVLIEICVIEVLGLLIYLFI